MSSLNRALVHSNAPVDRADHLAVATERCLNPHHVVGDHLDGADGRLLRIVEAFGRDADFAAVEDNLRRAVCITVGKRENMVRLCTIKVVTPLESAVLSNRDSERADVLTDDKATSEDANVDWAIAVVPNACFGDDDTSRKGRGAADWKSEQTRSGQ